MTRQVATYSNEYGTVRISPACRVRSSAALSAPNSSTETTIVTTGLARSSMTFAVQPARVAAAAPGDRVTALTALNHARQTRNAPSASLGRCHPVVSTPVPNAAAMTAATIDAEPAPVVRDHEDQAQREGHADRRVTARIAVEHDARRLVGDRPVQHVLQELAREDGAADRGDDPRGQPHPLAGERDHHEGRTEESERAVGDRTQEILGRLRRPWAHHRSALVGQLVDLPAQ